MRTGPLCFALILSQLPLASTDRAKPADQSTSHLVRVKGQPVAHYSCVEWRVCSEAGWWEWGASTLQGLG
jgi:hypothetical protein